MPQSPTLSFHDGHEMPQIGLGVWRVGDDEATRVVKEAVAAGYRLIDTAAFYENEPGTGAGVREGGVPREALFVTTKLWNGDHGFDAALRAFDASQQRLGLDHVDLYLIHWPCPTQDRFVETWKALVRLREDGRATSIGVSNFNAEQIERIADATGVLPVLNQIELHPRFQQRELKRFHDTRGIVTQAWSPLGQGKLLEDAQLAGIARKHGRTPAQVVLRWHVETGHSAIPKSVNPARIRANLDLFDFALDEDDHAAIAGMDESNGRYGPDPAELG